MGARALLVLGVALALAGPAAASTFQVTPVQVSLSAAASTALLTVTNESEEPLRLQVSAFAWDESPTGEMELVPTEDVVAFPLLLTVEPGSRRNVRLGTATGPAAIEKTYRIFFEELPALQKPEKLGPGPHIRILTRMGIPVFLAPANAEAKPAIEHVAVEQARVSFLVKNGGSAHFMLRELRVRGFDGAGRRVFDRRADGWYVLAGGSRAYALEIPRAECGRLNAVSVEIQTERETVSERAEVLAGGCAL